MLDCLQHYVALARVDATPSPRHADAWSDYCDLVERAFRDELAVDGAINFYVRGNLTEQEHERLNQRGIGSGAKTNEGGLVVFSLKLSEKVGEVLKIERHSLPAFLLQIQNDAATIAAWKVFRNLTPILPESGKGEPGFGRLMRAFRRFFQRD
jgi:hypothetical protein